MPGTTAPAVIAAYEAALDAYTGGDFAGALAGFAALADDPPSRVLGGALSRFPRDAAGGVEQGASSRRRSKSQGDGGRALTTRVLTSDRATP